MSHAVHDQVSLEMARRIVSGLAEHPEWLDIARANLRRWRELHGDSPAAMRRYVEWDDLLARPIEELSRILVEQSDEGQRLRQSSPFVGVLSAREVWSIKERIRARDSREGAA